MINAVKNEMQKILNEELFVKNNFITDLNDN